MSVEFARATVSAEERQLRLDVRAFLAKELPKGDGTPGLGMGAAHNPAFSAKLAAQGWVGMAIPKRYGGHDRRAFDRFVVVEELLAWGAPVSAHWVADRQSAQTILSYGTEDQKQQFLPEIAGGRCFFSIGMSEPDAGSDLAGVRTTATRATGGWILNGTKIWTSNAHRNQYFILLCRTSPVDGDKHNGLGQFLVPLDTPGIVRTPIKFLDGSDDFCEVVMTDAFIGEECLLGDAGMGWHQVTSELAYERAGPDRYLSTYQLLEAFVREHAHEATTPRVAEVLGRLTGRYRVIRELSMSIARSIDAGGAPAVQAALVKEMGTRFEQRVLAELQQLVDVQPHLDGDSVFERLLARATVVAPSFTIRGGTVEILRSVASKGLRRAGARS